VAQAMFRKLFKLATHNKLKQNPTVMLYSLS